MAKDDVLNKKGATQAPRRNPLQASYLPERGITRRLGALFHWSFS